MERWDEWEWLQRQSSHFGLPQSAPNDLHIRLSLVVSPSWLIFLPPVSPIELSDQVSQSFAFAFASAPTPAPVFASGKNSKQSWCHGTVFRASPGLGTHLHSSSTYNPCPDTKEICEKYLKYRLRCWLLPRHALPRLVALVMLLQAARQQREEKRTLTRTSTRCGTQEHGVSPNLRPKERLGNLNRAMFSR